MFPDRSPPIANICPEDQYIIGEGLLTIVSWAEPEWTNSTEIASIESNFKNGDVYYWGEFRVVYTATDASGSVDRCEFDVFVASNECEIPEYSSDSGKM
ncbi:hypothetical protein PMAYCL1PPCAC_10910, partial [Pristionchus mayeri]